MQIDVSFSGRLDKMASGVVGPRFSSNYPLLNRLRKAIALRQASSTLKA
jgi:hypothetical protein